MIEIDGNEEYEVKSIVNHRDGKATRQRKILGSQKVQEEVAKYHRQHPNGLRAPARKRRME